MPPPPPPLLLLLLLAAAVASAAAAAVASAAAAAAARCCCRWYMLLLLLHFPPTIAITVPSNDASVDFLKPILNSLVPRQLLQIARRQPPLQLYRLTCPALEHLHRAAGCSAARASCISFRAAAAAAAAAASAAAHARHVRPPPSLVLHQAATSVPPHPCCSRIAPYKAANVAGGINQFVAAARAEHRDEEEGRRLQRAQGDGGVRAVRRRFCTQLYTAFWYCLTMLMQVQGNVLET